MVFLCRFFVVVFHFFSALLILIKRHFYFIQSAFFSAVRNFPDFLRSFSINIFFFRLIKNIQKFEKSINFPFKLMFVFFGIRICKISVIF